MLGGKQMGGRTDSRQKNSESLADSEELPNASHYPLETEGKDQANIWRTKNSLKLGNWSTHAPT